MFSKTALAKLIDFTLLRPEATEDDVIRFCEQAREHHFACLVLFPTWLGVAHKQLKGTDVKLATVIGFPFGMIPTTCKVHEARQAVAMHATELEIVANLGWIKSGFYEQVQRDIEEVIQAAKIAGSTDDGEEIQTKIIIETGRTNREEQERVCRIAAQAEADFVKTCTGFGPRGASVQDVKLFRRWVGREVGVKAAGGIRCIEQAMAMLNAGANRIGTSAGLEIVRDYDRVCTPVMLEEQ